jgi:uncharacterized protein (TIGR03435 family)
MQTPAASAPDAASFEVASIRQNTSGQRAIPPIRFLPGRFEARNLSLRLLIQYAYALANFQPVQGRLPVLDQQFDITATTAEALARPGPRGSIGPINIALQRLLAERFSLLVRLEKRPVDGYALVLAREDRRLGPRLRPSTIDCARLRETGEPMSVRPDGTIPCSIRGHGPGGSFLAGSGHTLAEFASRLEFFLGAPLENRTGLVGPYDLDLIETGSFYDISQDGMRPGPDLNGALREQLGLRLQGAQVEVDFVVVDRASPPTEN